MVVAAYAKDGPYTGNGNVGQQFVIDFEFFATSEIIATTRVTATGAEAVLVETQDYTMTGTGSSPYTGGTLTLVGSLAATSTLTINRLTPQTQTTDLETSGELPADTLEDRYDKLTMMVQDLQEQVNRCLRVPVTDGSTVEAGCALDDAISRASGYLAFTAAGVPTVTGTIVSGVAADVTITPFAETFLDDTNAPGVLTTLLVTPLAQELLLAASQGAAQTVLGISAVAVLNEDTMGSNSDTQPPSQHSVVIYLTTGTLTLTNKTLTSPAINTPTITSPVINTGVSGTAIDTDGTLAANSDALLASQKAVKTYVTAQIPALPSYAQYSYTVAAGNHGGTATTNAWGTRPINTEDVDSGAIGSLAVNRITLSAGTYDFDIDAVFYAVDKTVIRLQNITAGSTIAQGTTVKVTVGGSDGGLCRVGGRFTVAAGQALEVQYYCNTTNADDGLGLAANKGNSEIYLIARFWKVA